ncbi:MAG: hypothetical protein EXR69_04850 [Myxococcales bacterium]|nr:hypothetical protein [Myxococcales bacterium]
MTPTTQDAATEPVEHAAPSAADPNKPTWSLFPVAGVDSDDGLGFGVRGQMDIHRAGVEPYKSSFVVHLFVTTEGYHHDRFKFDLLGLGEQGKLRLMGHFAFRAWLNDGYWGLGNGTPHDGAYDDRSAEDPLHKFYRYQLIQPFAHLTLRGEVKQLGRGDLSVYGSWEGRYSFIHAYSGSLLEQDQPYGVAGGLAGQLAVGALWDSRSPEITPDRGALLEASGRLIAMGSPDGGPSGAGAAGGLSPSAFGGPMLSVRGYVPLTTPGAHGVTWAGRAMGEWLVGPVPFYEMVHWGGFEPIAGVGGADTLRGDSFGRWHGPGKAVVQNELRIDVVEHPFLRRPLRWQLVPFGDAGAVWGVDLAEAGVVGDSSVAAPVFPVHPSGGLGVRAIWATTLVGRFDVAVAQDIVPNSSRAGGVGYGPSVGFYLAFDHTY